MFQLVESSGVSNEKALLSIRSTKGSSKVKPKSFSSFTQNQERSALKGLTGLNKTNVFNYMSAIRKHIRGKKLTRSNKGIKALSTIPSTLFRNKHRSHSMLKTTFCAARMEQNKAK